jgi:hypothetical protein
MHGECKVKFIQLHVVMKMCCVKHECVLLFFRTIAVNAVVVTFFVQVCWWISSQFQ